VPPLAATIQISKPGRTPRRTRSSARRRHMGRARYPRLGARRSEQPFASAPGRHGPDGVVPRELRRLSSGDQSFAHAGPSPPVAWCLMEAFAWDGVTARAPRPRGSRRCQRLGVHEWLLSDSIANGLPPVSRLALWRCPRRADERGPRRPRSPWEPAAVHAFSACPRCANGAF
jgi:hypothetical protein